jgi:double-stranded uracil-DNA glycosylase
MNTILPDLLQFNLDIVFCGTSARNKSAKLKAYYAGKRNLFYPTLASCGFTERLFNPDEYPKLLTQKIGLTDLAKFTHGSDRDLRNSDFDTDSLSKKILKFQPKILCFNGKKAAKIFLNLSKTTEVEYGLQHLEIGKTKLYVAPSTSPRNRKHWDEEIWYQIRKYIK